MTRFPDMTGPEKARITVATKKAKGVAEGYRAKVDAAKKVVEDVPRQVRPRSETVQYLDALIHKALTDGVELTQEEMLKAMQVLRDEIHEMDDLIARLREKH